MATRKCSPARYLVLVALALFVACDSNPTADSNPTDGAVYLCSGDCALSPSDLSRHPEVIVTRTFDELVDVAQSPMSIWLDRSVSSAITREDVQWLRAAPQCSYPLVLVGCPHVLYSFRELLSVHSIEGPYVDWDTQVLEPGFSISILNPNEKSYRIGGFQEQPTVSRILFVTDSLRSDM